jgi:hypothetical protein
MLQQKLIDYIKQQLNAGYDIQTIKSHLLKYGYDITTINQHINYFLTTQKEVKHIIHLSKGTMLFFVGLFVFIVLISSLTYLYLKPIEPTKYLLDIKIDVLTTSVKPGEVLKFNIELSNLGIIKRYDVFLIHQVLDNTNRLITSKEETIAIETKTSSKSEIKIPTTAKIGSYSIKTIARYHGKIATATDIFNVIKETIEPSCFDGIQNSDEQGIDCGGSCKPCEEEKRCPKTCNDFNICTRDYCNKESNYICVNEPIKPCCGNNVCEPGEGPLICAQDCKEEITKTPEEEIFKGMSIFEKLDKIKEISKIDPELAGKYCSAIVQRLYKYDCYSNLAETTGLVSNCDLIEKQRTREECYSIVAIKVNDSSICEDIVTDSRKDNCYMNFVIEGDYSICHKIINDYLRQSCEALDIMSKINQSEFE